MHHVPNWAQGQKGLETFAQYCAPTALAAYVGVPKLEAAELLRSIPGMAGSSRGAVSTGHWAMFIRNELDGQEMNDEEVLSAHPDHHPDLYWRNRKWPTVAQFLRANPKGTFFALSRGHTFLLCDGEIVGDTSYTSGMRLRVTRAWEMPARAEGLVPEEQKAWDRKQAAHANMKRERRARRKRQRGPDPLYEFNRLFRF